jgi:hypothetical protein
VEVVPRPADTPAVIRDFALAEGAERPPPGEFPALILVSHLIASLIVILVLWEAGSRVAMVAENSAEKGQGPDPAHI